MPAKSDITYGVIFSLTTLVWLIGEYLLGLHSTFIDKHAFYTNLFFFPAVYLMHRGISARKKALDGQISFLQALMSGVWISLTVAILSPVIFYIFIQLINPDFFTAMRDYAVASGKLTPSQAAAEFNMRTYMVFGAISSFIMGVITSFVIAWIIRKAPVAPVRAGKKSAKRTKNEN